METFEKDVNLPIELGKADNVANSATRNSWPICT